MGKNYFIAEELIELQLKSEQTELLNLIAEIESLSKIIENKMSLINKKQNNISSLEILKRRISNLQRF